MDFSQNKMPETVTNKTERKSLFSSFLDVLEAKEKQAQADRQLQEEKYLRRTQRIYDFHERQRAEALEIRRCLELVSSHARVLEGALRGAERADSTHAPLPAALGAHAAATARAMAAVLRDAAAIRARLSDHSQRHMDTLLAKMEAELGVWRAFVQRALDATHSAETTRDNLHNLIAEQRRVVREVCASAALTALSATPSPSPSPPSNESLTPSTPAAPHEHEQANACSTPIQQE